MWEELFAGVPLAPLLLFLLSPHPQLRNPPLHYPHLCFPNPLFTVIYSRTNVEIVLNRTNLGLWLCGHIICKMRAA